jgi:hypothetical protein
MEPFENAIAHFPNGNVTTPQSFALGLGLQFSADATRKETIGFTYSFADLLSDRDIKGDCDNENGVLIHSDLKIGQFIVNKAFLAKVPGSVTSSKSDTINTGSLKTGDKAVTPADRASPYTAFSYGNWPGQAVAQAALRSLIRSFGSRMRLWMMPQLCFLAVPMSVRITVKSFAPWADRKQPEILSFSFIIRPSRSA